MSHDRPALARWLGDLSLGTKLSGFVALIVVGVVTSYPFTHRRVGNPEEVSDAR